MAVTISSRAGVRRPLQQRQRRHQLPGRAEPALEAVLLGEGPAQPLEQVALRSRPCAPTPRRRRRPVSDTTTPVGRPPAPCSCRTCPRRMRPWCRSAPTGRAAPPTAAPPPVRRPGSGCRSPRARPAWFETYQRPARLPQSRPQRGCPASVSRFEPAIDIDRAPRTAGADVRPPRGRGAAHGLLLGVAPDTGWLELAARRPRAASQPAPAAGDDRGGRRRAGRGHALPADAAGARVPAGRAGGASGRRAGQRIAARLAAGGPADRARGRGRWRSAPARPLRGRLPAAGARRRGRPRRGALDRQRGVRRRAVRARLDAGACRRGARPAAT